MPEPIGLLYYVGIGLKRILGVDPRALQLQSFSTIKRNEDVRVSASALARLCVADKYLLVRNEHRPEVFGPFGGVIKFDYLASDQLDALEFRPEHSRDPSDMEQDIRGFVPRRRVARFRTWYLSQKGREDGPEGLRRELREELPRAGLPCPSSLDRIGWRLVRRVEEGPKPAIGKHYHQYRFFEVYDPKPQASEANSLLELLKPVLDSSNDVISVTAAEIKHGRSAAGHQIRQHAGYLLGEKQVRPEPPGF